MGDPLQRGRPILLEDQRMLGHLRSVSLRNLEVWGGAALADVHFEVIFEGHVAYRSHVERSASNPTWLSLALLSADAPEPESPDEEELVPLLPLHWPPLARSKEFDLRVWAALPGDTAPRVLLEQHVCLAQWVHTGWSSPSFGFVRPTNALLLGLADGIYCAPHQADELLPLLNRTHGRVVQDRRDQFVETFQLVDALNEFGAMMDTHRRIVTAEREQAALRSRLASVLQEREALLKRRRRRAQQQQQHQQHQQRQGSVRGDAAASGKAQDAAESTREAAVTPALVHALEPTLAEAEVAAAALKQASAGVSGGTEAQRAEKGRQRDALRWCQLAVDARRLHLVAQVIALFPITESRDAQRTSTLCIRGIALPRGDLTLHSEEQVSTALGYACHMVLLLAKYLEVPLRYAMHFVSSRSYLTDPSGDARTRFPLYWRGKATKPLFETALRMLGDNVSLLLHGVGREARRDMRDVSILDNLKWLTQHLMLEYQVATRATVGAH